MNEGLFTAYQSLPAWKRLMERIGGGRMHRPVRNRRRRAAVSGRGAFACHGAARAAGRAYGADRPAPGAGHRAPDRGRMRHAARARHPVQPRGHEPRQRVAAPERAGRPDRWAGKGAVRQRGRAFGPLRAPRPLSKRGHHAVRRGPHCAGWADGSAHPRRIRARAHGGGPGPVRHARRDRGRVPRQRRRRAAHRVFDDEIDSLRRFDCISQRSIARVKGARIGPATECLAADAQAAATA